MQSSGKDQTFRKYLLGGQLRRQPDGTNENLEESFYQSVSPMTVNDDTPFDEDF